MDPARIAKAVAAIEALPDRLRRDRYGYLLSGEDLATVATRTLEAIDDVGRADAPGELDLLATIDELAGLASAVDELPTRGQLRAIVDVVAEADADAELKAMATGPRPSLVEQEALADLSRRKRPAAGRPILSVLVRKGWAVYDADRDGWVLTDAGRKVLDEAAGR